MGKAGSYIGYVVNGVGYIKGNYKARTKPPTEDEAFNREKFGFAQQYLRNFKSHVRVGFKGYNPRFQGFAAAKSYLMKNALKVVDGKINIDPSLVKISYGNLPLPSNMRFEFQEPGIISINWDPSEKGGNDQAMAMVHTAQSGHTTGPVYGNMRSTGEQNINVHTFPGTTLHVYLAFIADDRSRQSDSVYLGKHEFQK